jgi:signal transduction histidine kinase
MIKSFFGSMTARIYLILIGGTFITGFLIISLAIHEREALDSHMRAIHTTERVQQLINILDHIPSNLRPTIGNIYNEYGIKVEFSDTSNTIGEVPDSDLTYTLRAALGKDRELSIIESSGNTCPTRDPVIETTIKETHRCEVIVTKLKDGTPITLVVAHRNLPPPPFRGNFIRDLILFFTALSLIALIIAHMTNQPLRKLAQAARRLSVDFEQKPLPIEKGPAEVQDASKAFNAMQDSIRNHIEERTCMLAAIAHDLQTPLTRLRLRLEKVEDNDLKEKLIADLAATQDMVREGLEFARIFSIDEKLELIDIDSLVESLCNDTKDAGAEITWEGKIGKPVLASHHALRRCFSNLIDNAIQYGNFAHVSIKQADNKAIVTIIDGGIGVPEDQLEAIFRPFNRLEQSRSRHFGGTGLGLTIARIIISKHKGSITLKNVGTNDLGLAAIIELPLASGHPRSDSVRQSYQ